LSAWLAAGLAGGLAFAGCFALQALLLEGLARLGVAQPLGVGRGAGGAADGGMGQVARPRPLPRPLGRTGLAFGTMEALLKTITMGGPTLLAGMLVALMQHTAYGGWARRRGLRFVILLHMAFNALVLGASIWLGAAMWWVVLPVAFLLLALSCWPRLDARTGAP
jgi:hypothetical protein